MHKSILKIIVVLIVALGSYSIANAGSITIEYGSDVIADSGSSLNTGYISVDSSFTYETIDIKTVANSGEGCSYSWKPGYLLEDTDDEALRLYGSRRFSIECQDLGSGLRSTAYVRVLLTSGAAKGGITGERPITVEVNLCDSDGDNCDESIFSESIKLMNGTVELAELYDQSSTERDTVFNPIDYGLSETDIVEFVASENNSSQREFKELCDGISCITPSDRKISKPINYFDQAVAVRSNMFERVLARMTVGELLAAGNTVVANYVPPASTCAIDSFYPTGGSGGTTGSNKQLNWTVTGSGTFETRKSGGPWGMGGVSNTGATNVVMPSSSTAYQLSCYVDGSTIPYQTRSVTLNPTAASGFNLSVTPDSGVVTGLTGVVETSRPDNCFIISATAYGTYTGNINLTDATIGLGSKLSIAKSGGSYGFGTTLNYSGTPTYPTARWCATLEQRASKGDYKIDIYGTGSDGSTTDDAEFDISLLNNTEGSYIEF